MYTEPDYVKKEDKRSIRLCTVYALLFSSAIGLLFLTVLSLWSSPQPLQEPPLIVEKPTFNR
jgi:hypothetical protein